MQACCNLRVAKLDISVRKIMRSSYIWAASGKVWVLLGRFTNRNRKRTLVQKADALNPTRAAFLT